MALDVLATLRNCGTGYQEKAPPIPICLSSMGQIGHVERKRGLYISPPLQRHVEMLIRDNDRAELVARDISDGRLGANDILNVVRLGSDTTDAIRAIKSMQMAVASWNDVINARANTGKYWDFTGQKASQTTVANAWSSFLTTGGTPAAQAFGAIPGPAVRDSTVTGAWPLPMTLSGSDILYMTNFGCNHATGTNVVLLVDTLISAGSITATIVTSQNVSTTSLSRWTGGAGLQIAMEVTTAFGTATGIPTATINYTNQAGSAGQSTGGISIGATSLIVGRLIPAASSAAVVPTAPYFPLASGDYGVRAVAQATFSGSSAGAGAAAALHIFKPLIFVPTLATVAFVERSTPAQIGGIRQLTEIAAATSKPCLGFFVCTSTTSTGQQTYLIETVWG